MVNLNRGMYKKTIEILTEHTYDEVGDRTVKTSY